MSMEGEWLRPSSSLGCFQTLSVSHAPLKTAAVFNVDDKEGECVGQQTTSGKGPVPAIVGLGTVAQVASATGHAGLLQMLGDTAQPDKVFGPEMSARSTPQISVHAAVRPRQIAPMTTTGQLALSDVAHSDSSSLGSSKSDEGRSSNSSGSLKTSPRCASKGRDTLERLTPRGGSKLRSTSTPAACNKLEAGNVASGAVFVPPETTAHKVEERLAPIRIRIPSCSPSGKVDDPLVPISARSRPVSQASKVPSHPPTPRVVATERDEAGSLSSPVPTSVPSSRPGVPAYSSVDLGEPFPTGRTDLTFTLGGTRNAPRCPRQPADSTVHLTVLKEIVGQEMRLLIREELRRAFLEQEKARAKVPNAGVSMFPQEPVPQALERIDSQKSLRESVKESLKEGFGESFSEQDFGKVDYASEEACRFVDIRSYVEDRDVWDRHAYAHAASSPCGCMGPCGCVGTSHPPLQHNWVVRLNDSWIFHSLMAVTVVANCAWLAYDSEKAMTTPTEQHSLQQPSVIVDWVFWAVFCFELLVRIWRHRMLYFYGSGWAFNWLDLVLVVLELFVRVPTASAARVVRVLKLAKVGQPLRLAAVFKPIRAILASVSDTACILLSSLTALAVTLFMFALLLTRGVSQHVSDMGHLPDAAKQAVLEDHGSVSRSMLTLLICSNGGEDWAPHFYVLEPTGLPNQLLFVACVLFVRLALLNIILGLFLDGTAKILRTDAGDAARRHAEDKKRAIDDIMCLFAEANVGCKDGVTPEEWSQAVRSGRLLGYLDMLGLRPVDVDGYFRACSACSKDGRVNVDQFVQGCMGMRGPVSSFDIMDLQLTMSEMSKKVASVAGSRSRVA